MTHRKSCAGGKLAKADAAHVFCNGAFAKGAIDPSHTAYAVRAALTPNYFAGHAKQKPTSSNSRSSLIKWFMPEGTACETRPPRRSTWVATRRARGSLSPLGRPHLLASKVLASPLATLTPSSATAACNCARWRSAPRASFFVVHAAFHSPASARIADSFSS